MDCKRNGKRCDHRRGKSSRDRSDYGVCLYILDTGKPRGCPVENCEHFTTKRCRELTDSELEKLWKY